METIAQLIELRRDDDSTGIVAGDRRWSWREVVARSDRYAAALGAKVTGEIRHIGLLMDNTPDFLFALFGAAMAGVTVVGLNTTRRGAELQRDIEHTDCSLVLTDRSRSDLLRELELGATEVVDVESETWAEVLAAADPDAPRPPVSGDDRLLLIFTSGSTSAPKAVIMSQRRAAGAAGSAAWFSSDDVLYCAMPLFHGNALNAIVFPALVSGATIALRDRFSATQFLDDLRRYDATFFTSVGRAISYVLATPERPEDRDHRVKFALAPETSVTDVREFRRRFGITCVTGYGSSENAVVMVPVQGMPADALGRPREGSEVAIVDPETLEVCPPAVFDEHGRLTNSNEAIGEIVGLDAAERFEGYYRNPEADAERSRNGWYWTGDLGYRDDDGIFYFAGRQGEWLRVDSENFAAAPVERILGRFPGAAAVAVFGVPDERTADDQVMAAVEMVDGQELDPVAFERFISEQRDLGPKWVPRYVRVTELPVGATNKIDRRRLQRERWHTGDPLFWRVERSSSFVPMTEHDRAALERRFEEHGRSSNRA